MGSGTKGAVVGGETRFFEACQEFFKSPVWADLMENMVDALGDDKPADSGRVRWRLWRVAADYVRDTWAVVNPEPLAEALEYFGRGYYEPERISVKRLQYGWVSPTFYSKGPGRRPTAVELRRRRHMLPFPVYFNLFYVGRSLGYEEGIINTRPYVCPVHGGPQWYVSDLWFFGGSLPTMWQAALLAYVRLVNTFAGGEYAPQPGRARLVSHLCCYQAVMGWE